MLPFEAYVRTYAAIFGGLAPLETQSALAGADGTALFDAWSDYLGALGVPDHRYDTPRQDQSTALMLATFERIGIALCDRTIEHDRAQLPKLVFDFDMPAVLDEGGFAKRVDGMHRTFLGYPLQLAPRARTERLRKLYEDVRTAHRAPDAGKSRFNPEEAGWAAVCYALVRHPEFHLY